MKKLLLAILALLSVFILFSGCATTERFPIYRAEKYRGWNDMIYVDIPSVSDVTFFHFTICTDDCEDITSAVILSKEAL